MMLFRKAGSQTSSFCFAALEKFRATDPDRGGNSKVTYAIDRASDRRRQFAISEDGTVTIQRALDRETVPTHQVKILAIGERKGRPSGSSLLECQIPVCTVLVSHCRGAASKCKFMDRIKSHFR